MTTCTHDSEMSPHSRHHHDHFSIEQIPDLRGKVILVTGATAGVGFETALTVAGKGAHTFVLGRSPQKIAASVEAIKRAFPVANVEGEIIDLSSLQSVKSFAARFRARHLPIHVLVNNAGVAFIPESLSVDGIEIIWATNHVGPWYLTTLLLDIIKRSAPSRIVFVSSQAHYGARRVPLTLEEVNSNIEKMHRYAESKLANILTAKQINKQLADENITNVYVNSVNPGVVKTDILKKAEHGFTRSIHLLLSWMVSLSVQDGALTQLYAATSPDIEVKGFRDCYFEPIAKLTIASTKAHDADLADKLWKHTKRLVRKSEEARDQAMMLP